MLDSSEIDYIFFQPVANDFFNLQSLSREINIGWLEVDSLPAQVGLEPSRTFGLVSAPLDEK